jgi:uncharacterized membrane protein
MGYEREIPRVNIAVADAVMRAGAPGETAMTATPLGLAQSGLATLQPCERIVTSIFGSEKRDSFEFVVDTTRWREFDPLDQQLVSLLFTEMKHSAAMSLLDLKVLLRSREVTYARGIAAWRASVVARAVADGLLEPMGRSRTAAGEELNERCEGLRDYIRDFGRLEDDKLMALELWGPYLVWAALFGLAERVVATMRPKAMGYYDDLMLAAETIAL